jgi:hypothetical protein
MKYIKRFENIIYPEISISLKGVCELYGGIYNAIDELTILHNNSDSEFKFYDSNDYKNEICVKFQKYGLTGPESIIIDCYYVYSYDYISQPGKDVILTFYNISKISEDILMLSHTDKFNL